MLIERIPTPVGGFLFGLFPKIPVESTPPEKQGSFFRGGALASGLSCGNHPKREPSRGGGDSFDQCGAWQLMLSRAHSAIQGAHTATLQDAVTRCNILQHTATHCSTLQHTATHCNTLQHTATHCNTLQHTATQCRSSYSAEPTALYKALDCPAIEATSSLAFEKTFR